MANKGTRTKKEVFLFAGKFAQNKEKIAEEAKEFTQRHIPRCYGE